MSTGTSRAGKRYLLRLGVALVAFVALMLVSTLGRTALADSPWRFVVAVLPVLPLAVVAVAVLRYLREADEMQRRIQLESLGAAFGFGSLLTLGYGLAQYVGAPAVSWVWVWPVYGACWLVALLVNRRRY